MGSAASAGGGPSAAPAGGLAALACRAAWLAPGVVARSGYLVWRGSAIVGFRARRPRGARVVGETDLVVPALVNAHAHLRFGALGGAKPRGFVPWIRRVLAAPPPTAPQVERRARSLREGGTLWVGDHDSDGGGAAAMRACRLRGVAFREFFAFDPASAAEVARRAAREGRRAAAGGVGAGLAVHAPFTVTLEGAAAAARSGLPVSVHFAESRDEIEWLAEGRGPIERLLWDRGRRPRFPVPGLGPVEWLERARLLRPETLLVHANELSRRELARIARARCVAVHCPGTHRYFRRDTPPVARFLAAGLAVALGTDSLASNDSLDLFEEMALLAEADCSLDPSAIVEAATTGGARALGLRGAGALLPGSIAAFVELDADVTTARPERFFRMALAETLVARPAVVRMVSPPYPLPTKR